VSKSLLPSAAYSPLSMARERNLYIRMKTSLGTLQTRSERIILRLLWCPRMTFSSMHMTARDSSPSCTSSIPRISTIISTKPSSIETVSLGIKRLWSTFTVPPTPTSKYALESLKIYDSNTVKEIISFLQEAFLKLNNARPVPLTHDEMTYYLQEKFCVDGRISVQSVMATSKAGNVSYGDTIKALVELNPPIDTRHKMAALVGEKEICRNNLAGR
jgi:hypothetical protein